MFNTNFAYTNFPFVASQYAVQGALINYARDAKCLGNEVYIKIDIRHLGRNYGAETIPIGNTARLAEYLSKEALDEVRNYAERLSHEVRDLNWDIPFIKNNVLHLMRLSYYVIFSEIYFECKEFIFKVGLECIKTERCNVADIESFLINHSKKNDWLFPSLVEEINARIDVYHIDVNKLTTGNQNTFIFRYKDLFLAWVFNPITKAVYEIIWNKEGIISLISGEKSLPFN